MAEYEEMKANSLKDAVTIVQQAERLKELERELEIEKKAHEHTACVMLNQIHDLNGEGKTKQCQVYLVLETSRYHILKEASAGGEGE